MKYLVAVLVVLAACAAEESPPTVLYHCVTSTQCGDEAVFTELTVCDGGAGEEITAWSSAWRTGCSALTLSRVTSRRCPYVVCAVFCNAEDAVVEACEP